MIDKAFNLDEHLDPTGATIRAVDTEGPLANAAGQDYDEAIFGTKSLIVVAMEKNYATLQDLIDRHVQYDDSLNSNDSWMGVNKMQARYEGIQCAPPETEGGVTFLSGRHPRLVFPKSRSPARSSIGAGSISKREPVS